MEFKYEIGGKTYTQKPLVLGQIRQLMNLMKGIVIPHDIDTPGLVSLLGDKLPQTIAVVITPEDMRLKDKDVKTLATEIEFEISPEQAIQVVEDFFDCNPIVSLLERLRKTAGKISEKMKETGLNKSASSSPVEILSSETPSSGDIH